MSVRLAALLGLFLATSALPGLAEPVSAPNAAPALAVRPAAILAAAPGIPRGWRSPRGVGGIKAGVATATTLLLAVGLWLDRSGRGGAARRARDAALAGLGVAGLLCAWNVGQFHYSHYPHHSDSYHYYLGSKYFPELEYARLYACVAIADRETGLDERALDRPMRNLETNQLETTATALADPASCKAHFSPERWADFRHDVRVLRGRVTPQRWRRFHQDHGYNATPAWAVLGRGLASTGPASPGQLLALQLIDPVLLAVMWGMVVWAFGWRLACAAAVFWGTTPVASFDWTGGAILRQDWLVATVVGICLLRRNRLLPAGFLLALAALLRIFPALVLGGIGLAALGRMLHERRLSLAPAERRVAVGALLALALWLPLGAVATGGLGSWTSFAQNSRTHLSTPLANHVGLRTVLSYDPEHRSELARDASLDDPMQRWKQARRERFSGFAALYVALVAGFAALVARAAGAQPLWIGAALGVAWIPVAAELTGYYWSVLLVLALLGARAPVLAPLTTGLAALGWAITEQWHWTDQIHVWQSVAGVSLAVISVLAVTQRSGAAAVANEDPVA